MTRLSWRDLFDSPTHDLLNLSWRDALRFPLGNILNLPWGNIPQYLSKNGARVYWGDLASWKTYKGNAQLLVTKIDEVLAATGSDKVNLIAHSKGGIDARYAISKLGMGPKVASLTTISTPHRGSCIADIVTGLIPEDDQIIESIIKLLAKLTGDDDPAGHEVIKELSRQYMRSFNAEVIDFPGVYYQSHGTLMKSMLNDPLFMLTYNILTKIEGENDGMVAVESSKWGNFRGVFTGREKHAGISHLQITGSVKDRISGVDIPRLYIDMVKDLKDKGY